VRRLSIAAACCLLVIVAAAGAQAETPAPAPATQGFSAWGWLRARLFGPSAPTESPAAALARRGGSRLLLEADTAGLRAELADELRTGVRERMRKARIPFRDLAARDGIVEVRVRDVNDLPRARSALTGAAADVQDAGDGLMRLTPLDRSHEWELDQLFDRSIEVITRRLHELGIATAGVQREGIDGIAVLLPGISDPTRVADVVARRGRLEFRLVDAAADPAATLKAGAPEGFEMLFDKAQRPYVVAKRALLTGADLLEANASFVANGNQPAVDFQFTEHGAQVFAHLTEDIVGQPFAIVLDGVVLSAPIVREPIRGGRGQISGGFTLEQANDFALLLRSGALAFVMTVVEARTVAPAKN
jgi:preprotein translocase subunit SecD